MSTRSEAIVFAGLMPHAPILLPGVGRAQLGQLRRTVWGMAKVAAHTVAAHPGTIVLISPHSPRRAEAFGIWQTPRLRGTPGQFGSTDDAIDLPLDRAFAERLETEAARVGLRTWRITGETLDHGAFVPLSYLVAAGWRGPTVIVSLPTSEHEGIDEFGGAIAATAEALDRHTAVIASGDMSHRLTAGAPGGYDPSGNRFDDTFMGLLRRGAVVEIGRIDPTLQAAAGEDVVGSTRLALAATGYATKGHDVLSYEGPFGVGYGVAILFEPGGVGRAAGEGAVISHEADLPTVARCAVFESLSQGTATPPFHAAGELVQPRGLFVTVRTSRNELRGCQGSSVPVARDLVWATWQHATAAAFSDTRFAPVQAKELPHLRFTVTILDPLEPVASPAELDPAQFGIVIATADGRRALLLPHIEGIDTAAQQLAVARRKGGIGQGESIDIQRFTARSFGERPT